MPLAQTASEHFPRDLEDQGMLAYVDYQVRKRGAAPAVTFGAITLNYADLALRTRSYAAGLAGCGVKAGTRVAVAVGRSESLIPLLLAIWSLRAAYVPIDPAHPLIRQTYILENAQADVLVTDNRHNGLQFAGVTVEPSELLRVPPRNFRTLAPADYLPSDCAYLIYTSGSTGNPKGVVITQGNLLNFLLAMKTRPGLKPQDRLLAITTIAFDIHILELFLPLLTGAQVVVAAKREASAPLELQGLIDRHRITALQATPATWRMLLSGGWQPRQPLKILVGGEALPSDLLPHLHAASTELWNMYGPTETTVWSTCHRISRNDDRIYIGRPIRHTTVHVVDEQLQPVADGVVGELLIGGAGVAAGYYRNPELTRQKFIHLPALESGVLYRTGDAVIRHSNGDIEYIDRIDNQIKIRGFRIEPGEIEQLLARWPQIRQAVVVAANFALNDKRLIAFYLGEPMPSTQLQDYCSEHLPAHMVPRYFVRLEQFPMTANLKVDRKVLVNMGTNYLTEQKKQIATNARDDLDLSLIAVWEKHLAVQGIGIDDDFFELGGHSLLALQVLSEMHQRTGLTFSSAAFFEKPTLRALRESLGEDTGGTASVVKLNQATLGEPVFCLCGMQVYRELAQQFGEQQPVFAIFAETEFSMIRAQSQRHQMNYSFDELVQAYVNAISRQGDFSSVTLIGLSFGGFVALEVADVLSKRGIRVSNVILLDTYLSTGSYRSLRKIAVDLARQFKRERFTGCWTFVLHRWLRLWRKIQLQASDASHRLHSDIKLSRKNRDRAYDCAATQYEDRPRRYHLDALLVKATRTYFGFGYTAKADYDLGSIIRGRLDIREVDSDHLGLMSDNAVRQTYNVIQEYMQQRQV